MAEVAERLMRVPAEPCQTFTDAVQCIFLMNCALHWTGELTSLGRLDQILAPYLDRDGLTEGQAQEIIDQPPPKVPDDSWNSSTLDDGTVVGNFVFGPAGGEQLETALETARQWDGADDQRSTPTLKSKMGRGYLPVNNMATPAAMVSNGYTK